MFTKMGFALVLCICLSVGGCKRIHNKVEAQAVSQKQIEEYALSEGMDPKVFREVDVTSDKAHPWIFDFESKTTPKHMVRIYVKANGKVEMHRMIE